MKKILILTTLLATFAYTESKAQHFIASFGIERQWNVPDYVSYVVYNTYWDYDWVHATRVLYNGEWNYDVILQRGNTFIRLNFDPYGEYRTVARYNYYPLVNHVCNEFCGFHDYFYHSYASAWHGNTHFAFHVIYHPRPVRYVYGHYRTIPKYAHAYPRTYHGPARVIVKDNRRVHRDYNENRRKQVSREPARRRDVTVNHASRNNSTVSANRESHSTSDHKQNASPVRRRASTDIKQQSKQKATSTRRTENSKQRVQANGNERTGGGRGVRRD